MNSFHFLRPDWFWALPPLFLLLFWMARRQLQSRSWQAVCDPELLPHLLLGRSVRRANWPIWLLLAGLLLAVLALAGPVWEPQPQPLFRQQSALVILFDLSRSMQASDLKPSRFLRARLKVEDLLRQRKEGQTALIVFAADAFTVTPLTEDRHTIEALIKSLDPGMMPAQGSNPALAIRLGEELMQQAGVKNGRLLLVTDEDKPEPFMAAARQLQQNGYELSVIGVGTPGGAPIPVPDGGFFKDAGGDLVLPKLNADGLRQLADAGGGTYHSLSVDDSDLKSVLSGLDSHRLDGSDESRSVTGDIWREEGVWLLWPLVLLAACAFRRGWLLLLPLLLLFPVPAEALSWEELWQTPDQQAADSFLQNDYAAAAQKFNDSRWKASALYRDGKYAEAAQTIKEPQTADDFYNKGNALAKQGDLSGAVTAYQQALKKSPQHADALFNKNLVEKELQKQQQEQQDQKQQSGDKNDNSDQQKNPDQDQGKSQAQQNSSSDNQTGEDQKQNPTQGDQESKSDPENRSEQKQSDAQAAEDKKEKEKRSEGVDTASLSEQESRTEQGEDKPTATAAELPAETAEQRETRLLLQQIPDDPGGLLRRKFLYQYRQRGQQTETDRSW